MRRGILGSGLIGLADLTGADLLGLVVALQSALFVVTAALFLRVFRRLDLGGLEWLLAFCPGFFLVFWSADPQGSMRKEIFVYLAFALMLLAAVDRRSVGLLLGLATLAFAVGVVSHEANVLFLPFVAAGLAMFWRAGRLGPLAAGAMAAVAVAGSGASVLFALLHTRIDDAMQVCAPLLERGVAPEICDGAISVLQETALFFIHITFWMVLSPNSLIFLVSYLAVSALVLYVATRFVDRAFAIKYYLLSALVFAPLYVIAVDWGRWLSFHVTAFSVLLVLYVVLGNIQRRGPAPRPVLAALIGSCFLWAPSHWAEIVAGGVLRTAWETVAAALA